MKTTGLLTTFFLPAPFSYKKRRTIGPGEQKRLSPFLSNPYQRYGPDPRRRGGSTQQQQLSSSGRLQHKLGAVGIGSESSPPPPPSLRSRRLRRLLRAPLDLQRRKKWRQRHYHRRPQLPLQRPAGRPQHGDLRQRAGVGGDARGPRRRAGGEAARF